MLWARRGLSWTQKHFTLYPSSASVAAADAPANPLPTTMMSNLRLLAGLTSLRSNLCLSHFCASGPEGILPSRFMLRAIDENLGASEGRVRLGSGSRRGQPCRRRPGVDLLLAIPQ